MIRTFLDDLNRVFLTSPFVHVIELAAQSEAAKAGLGAMDALHLAPAHLSPADEFITTEKPNKAIHFG
jgi:hypothetical protein